MPWYSILLTACIILLLIQMILNLTGLDVEMDLDVYTGDFITFKGAIHFLFGFSLVLTLYDTVNFSTLCLAVFVGFVSMLLLYWLYSFLYKKLKEERTYTEVFDNVDAVVIYYDENTNRGEVKVILPEGCFNLPFTNHTDEILKANDVIQVSGTRQTLKYK
jgi:hypothetical protein